MIKLTDLLKENTEIPQILYHATYKPLLKKIKEQGLDTTKSKKAWEDSKPGLVYLAKDIDVAASYAESSDMVPESYIDNIVVLHIDSNKLDKSKISIDKNVADNEGDTLEYEGIIPWSAIIDVTKY
jgi:RNA:NAD 2'-phosphotransferase (TPT1/KptA family)